MSRSSIPVNPLESCKNTSISDIMNEYAKAEVTVWIKLKDILRINGHIGPWNDTGVVIKNYTIIYTDENCEPVVFPNRHIFLPWNNIVAIQQSE